ncbi:MAG: zinc ABC transporter ATP-binding protein AztA [Acidimicrobiia bacterium]
MPEVLRVEGVSVRYGDVPALRDVDLVAAPGTSTAVIGPNGSGKSTLLRAIAGIAKPSTGRIERPGDAPPALVLQSTDVDRSLPISVRETVATARYATLGLFRPFRAGDRQAVERAIERMDLTHLRQRQLHELSGGQRQRVLVAQGLAQDSPILLLDEPVTGLDVVSRQLILDAVDEERARGRIVLMTTHSLDEARRCDQVLLLDGAAVACGSPDEVLQEGPLRVAFGGRFILVGEGLLLDDPHHDHAH